MMRGLQSRKPWVIPSRTSLMESPVRRPISSSSLELASTERSSRKTATPCMGSWQRGPWPVASWKAYAILSQRSRTSRAFISSEETTFCLESSSKLDIERRCQQKENTVILCWRADSQFFAGVDCSSIHQNVRSNSPRSECSNSVNDVLPKLFVFLDFFVEHLVQFVSEFIQ